MRFFLSGYFGYDNAGDEAVLAAMLDQISALVPGAEFVATSGNCAATAKQHTSTLYTLRAIPRDDFKALWREIKSCDVFLSGGGSLLQDVTSLRNIVYYTTLLRLAHLAKKPAMIYAQGIGPLQKPISQKLTRSVLQSRSTRVVTVRDPDSKNLLQTIGVARDIEITADPVWALTPDTRTQIVDAPRPVWCVALRSWLDAESPNAEAKLLEELRRVAGERKATLKFLAMQPERDKPLIQNLGVADEEILPTENMHPRRIMKMAGTCELMIGMRLHALIFAAAQGVPCVAISYDPKVKSLANLIGAPVIENASESELAKLGAAADSAASMSHARLAEMQSAARRTAELAAGLKC